MHHCPGATGWVGDISPGGCSKTRYGRMSYCKKHEIPCRNGCRNWYHLKNQDGCGSCVSRRAAEARRDRQAAMARKDADKQSSDDSFWNPPKGRKKEAKKDAYEEDAYFESKAYSSYDTTSTKDYYYDRTSTKDYYYSR